MQKRIQLKTSQDLLYPQDYSQEKFQKDLKAIFLNRLKMSEDFCAKIQIQKLGVEEESLQDLVNSSKKEDLQDLTFYPQTPKYKMEQLVLNEEQKEEILSTLSILEKQHIIYDEWGFNEIDPSPKSILNFYGEPGTGKTMTAQAIASKLGIKILALNYSEIESKYVGDAPKNLTKAFELAQKEDALLFFDEADSFLGKRITNVDSSSAQAINSLRSQMLILLENFNGIVIFATNLVKNYDKAFESRIFKHIKFELPNEELRKELIKKMIPSKVPFKNGEFLTNEQLDELVKLSEKFSGREIKNSILLTLSTGALASKTHFCFDDFKVSFEKVSKSKNELDKNSNLSDAIDKKLQSGDYKTYKLEKNEKE